MPDLDDVGDGVNKVASDAGETLGKDIGPLPLWGWIAVLAVGGFGAYWLFFRGRNQTANPTGLTLLPSGAMPQGGGGGGAGTTTPTGTATQIPTNLEWLTSAVGNVSRALSMDPNQVRFYLEQFLAGRRPVGSGQAESDFERVIQSAVQLGGQPPFQPQIPNVNVNPFESNVTWLQQALGFIPSNTPGSLRQEIIDLVNGRTTVLTPGAQALLDRLRNTIGYEPQPLSFTNPPAASPAPNPSPTPTPIPAPTPSTPTPSALDRTNRWAQLIDSAFQQVYGRAATDDEITYWANRMAGGLANVVAAIQQQHITESPTPTANITSGWGQTINNAFKQILFRNATDAEIYDIANRMQAGTLGNLAAIQAYIAGLRQPTAKAA